jgi:hypothetical protein
MERLFHHRMNILNLKINVDITGAVGNLFFIAPNYYIDVTYQN